MRYILTTIATLALLATAPGAQASALRCGNDLIVPGDSILDVEDACGTPDREVALIGQNDQRVGTAYYYRLHNKSDRKIIFRGGSVAAIEVLE